jgi:peptidoglycan/xylan/chitin deacetylase (PgdA/CDA1 family)
MITLMYHDIVLRHLELPGIHQQITEEIFYDQIKNIKNQILHPYDVSQDLKKGKKPKGILITFDDGGAGIISAAKVLASYNKIGVSFICPGTLDEGIWFYRLSNALASTDKKKIFWGGKWISINSTKSKKEAYELLYSSFFPLHYKTREQEIKLLIKQLGIGANLSKNLLQTMTLKQLMEASNTGGMIFGNHSWSHSDLAKQSKSIIDGEVSQAKKWLADSQLPTIDWFAFPSGSYNNLVLEIVLKHHPITFGVNPVEDSISVLPRIGIYYKDKSNVRFNSKIIFNGGIHKGYYNFSKMTKVIPKL